MNRITLFITAMLTVCFSSCAQNKETNNMQSTSKALVVYFSATGTTARVADIIAHATDGTLFQIEPQESYTAAHLNWNDPRSRSSLEMNNQQARPAIKNTIDDLNAYDVVFIGYPIWWDLAPRIINTFIENHHLEDKTLIPFATSGGSSITNSVRELRNAYPQLQWRDGKLLNTTNRKTISNWASDAMSKQ